MSFDRARAFTHRWEKGYTVDQGGKTLDGLTQSRYDEYRDKRKLARRDVQESTPEERTEIAREYWDAVRGDELPWPLSVATFDTAFNCGIGVARRFLQHAVGAKADGALGPKTMIAANAADAPSAAQRMVDMRRGYRYGLALANPARHGGSLNGWLNRDDDLDRQVES